MNKTTVRGMAHITGGGLVDNVPRVLPKTVDAVFDRSTWETPAIYEFIEKEGNVDHEEMYRVFNMGIGFVLFVRPDDANTALAAIRKAGEKAIIIGRVEKGTGISRLIN